MQGLRPWGLTTSGASRASHWPAAPAGADGAPVHDERHRPEQTTLYRLVQQHAATFFAQAEVEAGAGLPQFVKDGFDAFLECGIFPTITMVQVENTHHRAGGVVVPQAGVLRLCATARELGLATFLDGARL